MDAEQEYRAACAGCAIWRSEFRRWLTVVGDDRVTFLHGMLSNDVKRVQAGDGTYAALLTQQGKIVSDLRLYAESARLLLDVPAERTAAVTTALEKFIVADDVELEQRDDEQPLIGMTGPTASATLARVLATSLPPRRSLAHHSQGFRDATLRIVAVDEVDGDGYILAGPASLASDLSQALRAAGAEPIGRETLDVLRVEAGIPWYGIDMDDDVLLMETNLDRAVSFTKGCYLGQEVVERVAARGKVNKKLTGIIVEGDQLPAHDAALRADGRDVGRVTSAVRSPAVGRIIALAYVHRDYLQPGTVLGTITAGNEVKATVAALPFR